MTTTHLLEAMPVYVGRKLRPKPKHNLSDYSNSQMDKLRPVLERLDQLGLKKPADVLAHKEQLDTALANRRGIARESLETARRRIANDLLTGDIDPAEAQAQVMVAADTLEQTTEDLKQVRAVFEEAALIAYRAACDALQAATPDLLDDLRQLLEDTLDAQAAEYGEWEHPRLAFTYKTIHETAYRLRWATGEIDSGGALERIWWEFRRPDAIWNWRVDEARRRISSASNDGLQIREHSKRKHEGQEIRFISITGPTGPNLAQIAAHRDDFQPDVMTAPMVLTVADRIETAHLAHLGLPAPQPTPGAQPLPALPAKNPPRRPTQGLEVTDTVRPNTDAA